MWWNSPCRRAKVPTRRRISGGCVAERQPFASWDTSSNAPQSALLIYLVPPPTYTHTGAARQSSCCTSSGSDEIRFWKTEKIWIINGRLARDSACRGSVRRGKEMHACIVGCTCVFKASLKLRKKKKKNIKKWQKNNTGQKFYLPIFACTLEFHSYFFFSLSNQSFSVQQ